MYFLFELIQTSINNVDYSIEVCPKYFCHQEIIRYDLMIQPNSVEVDRSNLDQVGTT